MCTVSWLHRPDGYDVLCNRDERTSRRRAWMPRVWKTRGVRYLAPVDPAGGGTWIGVNEHGLTACVLNAHPRRFVIPRHPPTSRGILVLDLLGRRSLFEAATDSVTRDLTRFAPFTLLLLQPDARAFVVAWDGRHSFALPDAETLCPLASSSLDERAAVQHRKRVWRQQRRTTVGGLEAFHRSHDHGPGPWSVCMHRAGAETVSFTHISVSPGRVHLHYSPEPLCRADVIVTTTLERVTTDEHRTRPARILDIAG
jgi:hypothetical protein